MQTSDKLMLTNQGRYFAEGAYYAQLYFPS